MKAAVVAVLGALLLLLAAGAAAIAQAAGRREPSDEERFTEQERADYQLALEQQRTDRLGSVAGIVSDIARVIGTIIGVS